MIETKSFQSSAVYSYPFYMSRTGWEHRICGAKSDRWATTWLSGSVWPETCKFVWLNNLRSEWLLWQQAGITGYFYLLLLILILLIIIVFVTIVYHQVIIIILSLSLINVYHKLLFDKQPQSLTPKSMFFPFFYHKHKTTIYRRHCLLGWNDQIPIRHATRLCLHRDIFLRWYFYSSKVLFVPDICFSRELIQPY